MKGFTTMYDHRGKTAGFIISGTGFVMMLFERLHPVIINKGWSVEQHYSAFLWVALMGLFLVAYSKEKLEDERTRMVRLKALQISFGLLMALLLSFSFAGTLAGAEMDLEPKVLMMIPAFGLILYLLVFHVGLYKDEVWEYEDKGLWYNLRHLSANKWGILTYIIICTVLMALLALI